MSLCIRCNSCGETAEIAITHDYPKDWVMTKAATRGDPAFDLCPACAAGEGSLAVIEQIHKRATSMLNYMHGLLVLKFPPGCRVRTDSGREFTTARAPSVIRPMVMIDYINPDDPDAQASLLWEKPGDLERVD